MTFKRFLALCLVVSISALAVFSLSCAKKDEESSTKSKKSKSAGKEKSEPKEAQPPDTSTGGKTTITVYFADTGQQFLVPETREVEGPAVARAAVDALLKGPASPEHSAVIPAGTTLLGLTVADGIATVDLSQEFEANYPKGSSSETLVVYSIVDTLTEFSTVKSVRFLITGRAPAISGSNFDFSQPIAREAGFIKR